MRRITNYVGAGIGLMLSIGYYFIIRNMGALSYTEGFAGIFSGSRYRAVLYGGLSALHLDGQPDRLQGYRQRSLADDLRRHRGPLVQHLHWLRPTSWPAPRTVSRSSTSCCPCWSSWLWSLWSSVVILTNAERRIPVQYAKRVMGRKMYGGQASYIPIKVNMTGVMPIIFASTLCSLPGLIFRFINLDASSHPALYAFFSVFNYNSALYLIVYVLLIVAFNYFYVAIQYNPVDIANQLRKNNGTIPGIRPGKPTSDFITKTLSKITLIGAVFLAIVAGFPIILGNITGTSIQLGGTTLLIVVGVALETGRSLEGYMTARYHKGFLE